MQDPSLLLKLSKLTSEYQDKIVSYGEIMSSYIVSQALVMEGISTKQINASSIIVTNNNFGLADFYPSLTKRRVNTVLNPLVEQGIVPVVTGFIGATRIGKVTTLGRGGSDYTAAILGYCLAATEIQIWTDVSGVYSADPKIVKNAKVLKNISYGLAKTLAESGAKVLYPKTIEPAIMNGIPIRILNTFSPNSYGTSIAHDSQIMTKNIICGVTYKNFCQNKIIVSVVGLNIKSTLMQEVNNFLSVISKQKVHLYNHNNYCCQFLIESCNPNKIINALHNKYIA